jgi:hypothetical protein
VCWTDSRESGVIRTLACQQRHDHSRDDASLAHSSHLGGRAIPGRLRQVHATHRPCHRRGWHSRAGCHGARRPRGRRPGTLAGSHIFRRYRQGRHFLRLSKRPTHTCHLKGRPQAFRDNSHAGASVHLQRCVEGRKRGTIGRPVRPEIEAVQQWVEADEAWASHGASPLNPVLGRRSADCRDA